MSKERLEDIEERFAKYEYNYNLNGEDVEWLIRRVQELEEALEDYKTLNKELHQRRRKVRKQNKRYKQALEEIIRQQELEDEIDDYDFMWKVKQIARQALEGEE